MTAGTDVPAGRDHLAGTDLSAGTDLLYSEVEDDLRGSVRDLLADRAPIESVLADVENGAPYRAAAWRGLAVEMGLAGLAVPERFGGAGASLREAAVVCEEIGRAVTPVPFLTSAVVATTVLGGLVGDGESEAGGDGPVDNAAVEALLTALAAGEKTAALVVSFATPPAPLTAHPVTAEGNVLTGAVTNVADALGADVLLVPTAGELYAVDAAAAGLTRAAVVTLDLTRPISDVTFAGVTGTLLATGDQAGAAVVAGLTAGAALLASEQLGLAEACVERTIEYLKTRYQFGRQIGSFQALKHRIADVWVAVAQARATARHAAVCVATGHPDTAIATAVAQAFCSPVAVTAAEECVQLHGGIGFTWEHPAHLYLKRAKSASIAFGTADRHRAALADLVDLPAAG